MEFFCYHRDRAGSVALRAELVEDHWGYMDRYAAELIARGPTFEAGGEVPTGSVHVVDLPGPAAARAFAFDEPNYQAGVYRDVLLRRWRNLLGRTMWEFPGGRTGGNRYLVLGLGPLHADADADTDTGGGDGGDRAVSGPGGLPPGTGHDDLIAFGPLLSDDGTTWIGTAALVRAPDPDEALAVLAPVRYADVEVRDWEFGGRR
ncbi:YciI family protein [Streptomyces sp. NPDC008092]|uniref:YciI family protein n=1 Tax=Streptomyces sp. NPDC008092 TaxID=3364808 RepID=UPI0036EEB3E5